MNFRIYLPVLGILLLVGCTPGATTPDGAVLLDEQIALARRSDVDSAQREIMVDGKSVIVALVDEQLTDVRLKLTLAGDKPLETEVENNLAGAGFEIATLEAPRGSRVTVTLTSAQDAKVPGHVRLTVRRFDESPEESKLATQLQGFKAWSVATSASHRADAIKKSGLADIDRAIASFESPQGDAALAARARLIRANMFHFFRVGKRESRAEAQRAAQAFRTLADPLNEARAKYIEALALTEIWGDASVDPTPEEAIKLVREILTELGGPGSVFGPIERARAIAAHAGLDVEAGFTNDSRNRYLAAQAIYHDAGWIAGERDMRFGLAGVLLNLGQFRDAAQAFDPLISELGKISNPDRRAAMHLHAARARVFSGRNDEAQELLHDALLLAREYNLRAQESAALQGLGNFYLYRGDTLRAGNLYEEVLKITKEEHDTVGLNAGLQAAGYVARTEGEYARAIEMHKEGVRIATTPVARMRTMRELGMDYLFAGDYPAAIAQFRGGLAVKLQDPRHHAYSDLKRNLVEALIANGDITRANRKEAERLLAESTESSVRVGDKLSEIGGHRVNAQLLASLGHLAEARAEYELALALAHEYREKSASMEARKAMLLHEQAAFRGYLDLEMKSVATRGAGKLRPASQREERALRMLEFARDANYGATRSGELDAETSVRVDGLFTQMGDQTLKIARMLNRELEPGEQTELERLQLEMLNLYTELDRVRTTASARRAVAENFRPDAARAWRKIGKGVVQVSYALGNDHVYVWSRSESGIVASVLARSPKDLEQELIELGALDRHAVPAKVEQALERVSALLLPAGLLPESSSAVEIVAEGRIAGVPFAGLASPGSRAHRLAETHAITMITSMLAAQDTPRPKQPRPFRLVALASGNGTLRSAAVVDPVPRLQAATSEIRAVADLFEARDPAAKIKLLTGNEGSAVALRGIWGSGADVVHFATHALADLRQPLASLLVLPAHDAGGKPTYLTAGQVQLWRGDADLVFLSACESAIGPPRFAGGMPGLQSAFLRAGARGVIATLWPIEDVLAQEFAADFYQRYTSGRAAAQALSETQRAWLAPKAGAGDSEQLRRRITALAHGFYTQ